MYAGTLRRRPSASAQLESTPRPPTYLPYDSRASSVLSSVSGMALPLSAGSAGTTTSSINNSQVDANTAYNAAPSNVRSDYIPPPPLVSSSAHNVHAGNTNQRSYGMSRAGPSTSGPAPKPAYYATPSPRAPYSTAASDSTRPPASSRPLPNPSVSRKLSARSAQAPVARAASYMTRRRSAGNYPGIAYGDPASMQRRHSRSACPVGRAASRTTVYDARPNAVKFKAKGQTQNGVSLQDAMNGVQLSRSKRYLTSDLHLDANMHLTLKISWPGHQPLRYLVPVKGYNGCVDLPTLLRRIARGCHHYLDSQRILLIWERVRIHRLEETTYGHWQVLLTTH